VTDKPTNKLR